MTAPCGVNGHGLKIPVALRGRQDRAGPWLGSSHRVPGLGTGIRAQPVPFCPHREGAGVSSHPAQTPQGEEAESCSPQRPVWSVLCLSTYFSHLSSSPLFPAQFEAELLATKPSQCQQTTGPHGTAMEVAFGSVLAQAQGSWPPVRMSAWVCLATN